MRRSSSSVQFEKQHQIKINSLTLENIRHFTIMTWELKISSDFLGKIWWSLLSGDLKSSYLWKTWKLTVWISGGKWSCFLSKHLLSCDKDINTILRKQNITYRRKSEEIMCNRSDQARTWRRCHRTPSRSHWTLRYSVWTSISLRHFVIIFYVPVQRVVTVLLPAWSLTFDLYDLMHVSGLRTNPSQRKCNKNEKTISHFMNYTVMKCKSWKIYPHA